MNDTKIIFTVTKKTVLHIFDNVICSLFGDGRHLTLCTKKNLRLTFSGPKETDSTSPVRGTVLASDCGTDTENNKVITIMKIHVARTLA